MTGFAGWAVAGLLWGAAVVSIASVGVLLLPLAVAALALAAYRWRSGAAGTGAVTGLGAAVAGVGVLNLGTACDRATGSCGLDPLPWLLAGGAAIVGGVVAHAALCRR